MFTERDFDHTPDLTDAVSINLSSGEDVLISEEGVYLLSGTAQEVSVTVSVPDKEAKVQLVLDGVSVVNSDAPVIDVRSADKVFVTTTDSDNRLEVTGAFAPDGSVSLDAVIFSNEDVVLNGLGGLEILSPTGNGVTSKDDLKVTGGTISISSGLDGLEANDSLRIGGGALAIDSGKDGLHSEYDEDDTVGFVYVLDGSVQIAAADDGIRATTYVQIEGGSIDIGTVVEGIEATFIQFNGGEVSVVASDDGINAARKSASEDLLIEINGGHIFVEVGQGDTDAFDSNGDITINDGTIEVVTPGSSFDADGTISFNGGTVIINGEAVTEIPQGGPGPGGGGGGGG
ncbi:MAG: carbohydrate-binding domain-containing protein [Nannocystaceae bacterium]|nr:carbohydrate-binding domain-containing protein [Nannocystaceae bacterium]